MEGGLNSISKCGMRRLLGYSCNLYSALENQSKMLNALEIYTTLVIEFVLHHRFSAILVMLIIPNFMDVQRLEVVFKTSIQFTALTRHPISHGVYIPPSPYRLLPVAHDECG